MAIQTIPGGGVPFPVWPVVAAGAPSISNLLIDADTEKVAAIFTASVDKNIRKLHVRLGTTTTGATVTGSVETVDTAANGDPTGTLWAANTNGTVVVANGDDNVWKEITLTADADLSIGDVFALVLANGTGGNMNLRTYGDNGSGFPFGDHYTTAWAKLASAPLIVPEYSDGSFAPCLGRFAAGDPVTATTFATDTATTRRGNLFQVPFPCHTSGAWVWVDADGPFTIKLYDSAGTSALATTATINQFQRQQDNPLLQFYPFTNGGVTLSANINYRIVAEPTTTTDIIVYHFDAPSTGYLNQFSGGANCFLTTYNGSAWSDAATTSRMWIGVFLDGFSDGVGGGAHQNNF